MALEYYQQFDDDDDDFDLDNDSHSDFVKGKRETKGNHTSGEYGDDLDRSDSHEEPIFRGFLELKREVIIRYRKKKQEEFLVKFFSFIAVLCLIWVATYFAGIHFRGYGLSTLTNPPLHVLLTSLYLSTWIMTSNHFVAQRKKAEEKFDEIKRRLQKVADQRLCHHEMKCRCKERFFKELEEEGIQIYH